MNLVKTKERFSYLKEIPAFLTLEPLLLIIAVAFALRLFIVISADFPLNDGGMFYSMVNDIKNSNFTLPKYTSYLNSNIPFAYPPFSFYFAAFLTKYFSFSLISVMRFIPLIFSVITIPLVYLITKEIFNRRFAVITSLVFSLLPRSYVWQIMGGGLTRSVGFVFSLVSIYYGIQMFKKTGLKNTILAVLSMSLTILCHLEWTAFSAYSLFILGFLFKNFFKNIIALAKIGLLSGIATSFWWVNILSKHGIDPFINFFRSGVSLNDPSSIFLLSTLYITDEPFLTIWGVLILLGIGLSIKKGFRWLVFWFVFPLLFIPRSSPNLIVVPASLLISLAIIEVLLPAFTKSSKVLKSNNFTFYLYLSFIGLYLIVSSLSLIPLSEYFHFINRSERTTMDWIKKNTPEDAKFILLTKGTSGHWGMDPVSEWFPALSERTSISTPQGSEWLPGNNFYDQVTLYEDIKKCYFKELSCLEKTAAGKYSFVYVSKYPQSEADYLYSMRQNLATSGNYTRIFDSDSVSIFSRND